MREFLTLMRMLVAVNVVFLVAALLLLVLGWGLKDLYLALIEGWLDGAGWPLLIFLVAGFPVAVASWRRDFRRS